MNKEKLVEYVTKLHQSVPHLFPEEVIDEAKAFESSDPAKIMLFAQELLIKYTQKKDK